MRPLIAHRVSRGQLPCSAETGAYCQARKRQEVTANDLAELYRARWNAEASHAHYVQRYTFWQEDEAAYTWNQGIIGSGAMATAMPARHSRRRAMSDVTDDRVPPPRLTTGNRIIPLKELWTSLPEPNRQKILQGLGQVLQRRLESPPVRKEVSNERV